MFPCRPPWAPSRRSPAERRSPPHHQGEPGLSTPMGEGQRKKKETDWFSFSQRVIIWHKHENSKPRSFSRNMRTPKFLTNTICLLWTHEGKQKIVDLSGQSLVNIRQTRKHEHVRNCKCTRPQRVLVFSLSPPSRHFEVYCQNTVNY